MHTNTVSVTTYNTLYEVGDQLVAMLCYQQHTGSDALPVCQYSGDWRGVWLAAVPPLCVQILTEQVCTQVVHKPHPEPDSTIKIQNPSKY